MLEDFFLSDHQISILKGIFKILGIMLVCVSIGSLTKPKPSRENRFGARPETMTFDQAIHSFYRIFFNFKGRASRSEHWYPQLFIVGVAVSFCFFGGLGFFLGLLSIVVSFIPLLSLTTRRLHDINRNGWYQLLGWFTVLGMLVLFVWMCTASYDEQPADQLQAV